MKNKRAISLCMLLFSLFNFTACEKTENAEVKVDLFDNEKALNISKDYLFNIKNGNIDGANKLCTDELLKGNVNIGEGISKISSFDKEKSIEGNNFAYYIYNIIRTSSTEPKSDLEQYTIKVNRNGDNYIIGEIKSKSQRELYIKNNAIRIIGDKGGKSSLVISLNNIPKDTYLSKNKMMLYKEKVPNNNFGKVVLGFTGKKVAISTIDDKNSYICIAYIDDTLMNGGTDVVDLNSDSQSSQIGGEIQDAFEKPVASKVISVDLINNSEIDDFIFSKSVKLSLFSAILNFSYKV